MSACFGPVPSRRLGQSLGIDTIPLKTCNWNCVYCQLGRTMPLTNERRAYVDDEAVLDEVARALRRHPAGSIDWVTFVGSGEPTLHSGLGGLIRAVKRLTELPVAVITNGALLYRPDVREELLAADAVMPTLDAGDPDLYRQINRPHPDITFARHVDGLVEFGRVYRGHLWVEVMLMRGLNDSEPALRDIAAVLARVAPEEIHINLPTRPPVEWWVEPADEDGVLRAQAILGRVARVLHPAGGLPDLRDHDDLGAAIVDVITRHPLSDADLREAIEAVAPDRADAVLSGLLARGLAQTVERYGVRFWSAAPSRYPTEAQSARVDPRRKHSRERPRETPPAS